MSAVVLLNPQAAGLRRPMADWLAHHAPGVSLLMPEGVQAARARLAILAPRTRVALVGGDGTLSAMLPALLRNGLRVGLVPAGRANRVAGALGLGALDWARALMYALHAPTAPVDVGLLETDRTVLHFIGSVTTEGPLPRSVLRIDREPAPAPRDLASLRIGNAHAGGSPFDGRLDVFAERAVHRLRRLFQPADRRTEHRTARRLHLETGQPVRLRVDGDLLPGACTGLRADILPRALDLTGPHAAAAHPSRIADTAW